MNVATTLPTVSFQETQQPRNLETVKAKAREFEAVFLAQMLQQMFNETEQDPFFSDPESEEIYRGMLAEEYGKSIAGAGGIGLSDYVTKTMLDMQEIKQ